MSAEITGLAALLDQRPELADVGTAAQMVALEVSAA